jgi:hypothetical protein
MSTLNTHKSFNTYIDEYSAWRDQNKIRDAKRQEYLRRNPDAIKDYDIQRSKRLLKAVDIMDKSISNETKQKVINIINNHKEIKKINHFNSTPVGYQYQISFTIFVYGNLSTYESHAIADKLEKEITRKYDDIYLTVIHVNPIDTQKES